MKKNIDYMLRNVKSKKITPEEKNYLWSAISRQLKLSGQTERVGQKSRSNYFVLTSFSYKKIIAAATLVALLVFGTATASAFDDVYPGDFFFPVDIAAEKVLLTLTFGDTEDVFRLRFAEERLDEVRALLALAESIEIEGVSTMSTDSSDSEDEDDSDETDTTAAASNDGESNEESDDSTSIETESGTESDTNENGVDLVEEEFLNSFDFDLDTVEDALLFALAQLEESKAVFASNGNANGVVAINSFIAQLTHLTLNHIDKLDRVAVTIKDGGNEDVKIKISASSRELKTRFEFIETTDSNGITTQRITFRNEESNSVLKSNEEGGFKFSFNFRKKDNNKGGKDSNDGKDDDENGDDDDGKSGKKNKNKIKVCHKDKKTLSISKNARWAHLLHGDSLGPCVGDSGDGDGDGDNDDSTDPVITDIAASPGITTAEITWDTDENADSKVWFDSVSPVNPHSPTSHKDSDALTQNHTIILTGLSASTTYYYVVTSEDEFGNSTASSEHSFETLQQPDPGDITAPVMSNITAVVATTSASVSWDTDEDADSAVYYSSTTPVDAGTASKVENASLVTSHLLELPSLSASTTYYYIVVSKDGSGNTATSTEKSFDTLAESETEPLADTTPPELSNITTNATTTEALVEWNTDEDADSMVFFGESSPVDPETATKVVNSALVTDHSLTLLSLSPDTNYYFLVVSKDADRNTATSTEQSFTTESIPLSEDTAAPVMSAITSFDIGSTTAAVSWTTDENANGKLWYGTDNPLIISDVTDMLSHTDFITSHTLFLDGLVASTTYQFLIVSTDEAGNTATSTQQAFTTTSE